MPSSQLPKGALPQPPDLTLNANFSRGKTAGGFTVPSSDPNKNSKSLNNNTSSQKIKVSPLKASATIPLGTPVTRETVGSKKLAVYGDFDINLKALGARTTVLKTPMPPGSDSFVPTSTPGQDASLVFGDYHAAFGGLSLNESMSTVPSFVAPPHHHHQQQQRALTANAPHPSHAGVQLYQSGASARRSSMTTKERLAVDAAAPRSHLPGGLQSPGSPSSSPGGVSSAVLPPARRHASALDEELTRAAMQRPDGSYQYVGRQERAAEYPVTRANVKDLVRDYGMALAALGIVAGVNGLVGSGGNSSDAYYDVAGGGGGAQADAGRNPLAADLNGVQSSVEADYRGRRALWAVVEATKDLARSKAAIARRRSKITGGYRDDVTAATHFIPDKPIGSLSTLQLTAPLRASVEQRQEPDDQDEGADDPEDVDASQTTRAARQKGPAGRPQSAALRFASSSSSNRGHQQRPHVLDDGSLGLPASELIPETLATFFAEVASVDWAASAASRETLSRCLFEQKWTDLACDELSTQVSMQCVEHGNLLRQLRSAYAESFENVARLHSDSLWQLDAVSAGLIRCWRRLREAENLWDEHEKKLYERADNMARDVELKFEDEYKQMAKIRKDATGEVERMGNTLKTLNGIFKDMQTDNVTMTIQDLNSKCGAQDKEIRALKEKLKQVQDLKNDVMSEKIKAALAKQEVAEMKAKLEAKEIEVKAKDREIAELIEAEYQGRVEIEKIKAKMEAESSDEETEDKGAGDGTGIIGMKSTMYMARITEKGQVIWKQAMSEMDNVAEEFDRAKPNFKMLCHSYRLMLPNLGPRVRPHRNVQWVRRCMRAILHAKSMDDSLCTRREDQRARFPETVYSWFEPSPNFLKSMPDDESVKDVVNMANQDRWGVYYGAKNMSIDDPEAFLFFTFLDESKGEDYLTFAIYCMQVAEGICGELLRRQFGFCQHGVGGFCQTFESLKSAMASCNMLISSSTDDAPKGDYGAGAAPAIWLPLFAAEEAVNIVLSTATADNLNGALLSTRSMGVECTDRITDEDAERYCRQKAVFVAYQDGDDNGSACSSVELFNDDASVDSIGEVKKKPLLEEDKPQCVNLFMWLKSVLTVYEKESAHRRACCRVMFETASTGALTKEMPMSSTLAIDPYAQSGDDKFIDLPQFLAIARTLYPFISTSEAAALFRASYNVLFPPSKHNKPPPPGITFPAFLEAADSRQFFSMSMMVPSFLSSEQQNNLSSHVSQKLRSLIHMHSEQLRPTIAEIKKTLTDVQRWRVDCMMNDLGNALFDEFSINAGRATRAMRPMCAYRRLLAFLLQLKYARHEKGDGFVLKLVDSQVDVYSNKTAATEQKIGKRTLKKQETQGFFELTTKAAEKKRLIKRSGELYEIVDSSKVMAQSLKELDSLREMIMDYSVDRGIKVLRSIKDGAGAIRLQRCWRNKMGRECGPPMELRMVMRPGYMRGEGEIRHRRVHRPPWWVQGMVAEILTMFLHTSRAAARKFEAPPTLVTVIFRFFIMRWGDVSLAERDIHDFFMNLRGAAPVISRCKVFSAFSRCGLKIGSPEDRKCYEQMGEDSDPLHFYLRSIMLVHEVSHHTQQAQAQKLHNQYNPSSHSILFPSSSVDARGRVSWKEPSMVLSKCTKTLYQKVYDSGQDPSGKNSYLQLLHAIEDMASGKEMLVDVDDWLLMIVNHYCGINQRRLALADQEAFKGDDFDNGREAFLNIGYYHEFKVKASSNLIEGAPEGSSAQAVSALTRQMSTGNAETDQTALNDEARIFHEIIHMAVRGEHSPTNAVALALHKHLMLDLNLPIPMTNIPISDGEQIAKQLILTWASFKRPLKFILEDLGETGGFSGGGGGGGSPGGGGGVSSPKGSPVRKQSDVRVQYAGLIAPSDKAMDTITEALKVLIEGGGAGGEAGGDPDGNEGKPLGERLARLSGSNLSRPNSASLNAGAEDKQRKAVIDMAVQGWLTFRDICDKVKRAYADEILNSQKWRGNHYRDPLLLIEHPLRDSWEVGREAL